MNEIEYERMQENAAIGQAIAANLQAILDEHGATDVADLYRTLYKYTDCGPWLSVKLHDGTWKHCHELQGISNCNVRALLVGSIVEGSDAEVLGRGIDLMDYMDEGGEAKAVEAFNREVEQVNDEACRLWGEANNEDTDEPWVLVAYAENEPLRLFGPFETQEEALLYGAAHHADGAYEAKAIQQPTN